MSTVNLFYKKMICFNFSLSLELHNMSNCWYGLLLKIYLQKVLKNYNYFECFVWRLSDFFCILHAELGLNPPRVPSFVTRRWQLTHF